MTGDGRRGWWPPPLRIEHLWASVPVALAAWYALLNPLRLLDFWWHLKAGEVIVTTGTIPDTDLFSFTAAGQPFVLQNWLVEVLYSTAYRAGGLPLVVLLNAALVVATLVPICHMCIEAAGRLRLGVIAAIPTTVALVVFSHARSQVFAFACFAAFYWVLSGFCRQGRNRLWLLPLIMLSWVNLHGAFVLGLALSAVFLGCEVTRRVVRGPRSDTMPWARLGRLALVCAVTGAVTLLNPMGYRIYSAVTAVALDPTSQSMVAEWQPPRVDRVGMGTLFGPLLLSLVVLLYARSRLTFTDLILFLGSALFAFTAVRNGIWFVLIAAPILARHIATLDAGEILGSLERFRGIAVLVHCVKARMARSSSAPIRYGLNTMIAGLMLALTVVLSPWVRPHLGIGWRGWGTSLWEPQTPVRAMDFIERRALSGNIFHPQIYGDYLIWRLWPRQRSFIDGRVHLFGESLVKDYLLAFQDTHWEERLSRHAIRYLLLSKADENEHMMIEAARISLSWCVLYEDELSVMFGASEVCPTPSQAR